LPDGNSRLHLNRDPLDLIERDSSPVRSYGLAGAWAFMRRHGLRVFELRCLATKREVIVE